MTTTISSRLKPWESVNPIDEKGMRIERYTAEYKDAWDAFVKESKNGTFLFLRDYMDYHSDRFPDFSLLFYEDSGELIALLPATRTHPNASLITSHAGLTYGGLIMNAECTAVKVCQIFELLLSYLRERQILTLTYKAIPHIYHRLPAEEDLFALTQVCKAPIVCRKASAVIDLQHPLPFHKHRQYHIRAALRKGMTICASTDFAAYWPILSETLQRKYGAQPVHTLSEIEMLHRRFPDNIHLWLTQLDGQTLSGAALFVTDTCVHAQYICSSLQGNKLHANEVMIDHILHHYAHLRYFDFGTSADEGPYGLNETLMEAKESYGCRTVVYDTYSIAT